MNDSPSRYEEFSNDQEERQKLIDALIELVPGAVVEPNSDTLKILADAKGHSALRDSAVSVLGYLSKDPKYSNVRSSGAGSYKVEADLVEPVAGIRKIEYYFNKETS